MSTELRSTIGSLILLGITMVVPGGRVLVLPAIFTLILVLLYWAAKPKPKEDDGG
jgi:hypothetical protein